MAAQPLLHEVVEVTGEAARERDLESPGATSFMRIRSSDRPPPPDERTAVMRMAAPDPIQLRARLEEEIDRRHAAEQSVRDLERRLLEAESMQIVAWQTASAVHDFNNLMAVILAGSYALLASLDTNDSMREVAEDIQTAGQRATDLVRRLLASVRPRAPEPKLCNLNDVVVGLAPMVHHILGPTRELTMKLAPTLGQVRVDPEQVEHLLLNLVTNARDAMPAGGRLTIETRNVEASDAEAGGAGRTRGPRVVIEVQDTGTGIDPDVAARIFEPFFTTKREGEGTGLGLFNVLQVVRQHRGDIFVRTEPGRGTTFEMHLPRVHAGLARTSHPPRRLTDDDEPA